MQTSATTHQRHAATFLTHIFGGGLADERYRVTRYRAACNRGKSPGSQPAVRLRMRSGRDGMVGAPGMSRRTFAPVTQNDRNYLRLQACWLGGRN